MTAAIAASEKADHASRPQSAMGSAAPKIASALANAIIEEAGQLEMRGHFQEAGQKLSMALTNTSLLPAERKELASKAAKARWAKRKAEK